jgi:hypothetical protein
MWLARALGAGVEEEHVDEDVETVTRESLEAFYNAHDPTKLSNIDQVLDTFGNGSELIKALKEKYGASPETERREGAAAVDESDGDPSAEEGLRDSDLEANIRELNAKFVATVQQLQAEEARRAELEVALQEAQASSSHPAATDQGHVDGGDAELAKKVSEAEEEVCSLAV